MATSPVKMKTTTIDDDLKPTPILSLAHAKNHSISPRALSSTPTLPSMSSLSSSTQPSALTATFPATQNKSLDLPTTKDILKLSEGQVVVVKFGGNAISNEQVLDSLIDDTIALANEGIHVIVVHGGGTAVNDALAAVGKQTEKVNGLRVTDSETLGIAVDVFTEINEYLGEKFRQKGANALSFCSKSANPFLTEKMVLKDTPQSQVDLGWVGEIVGVDAGMLESWVFAGWIPIVSPLGMDAVGHFYNINADHAALALASCLQADGLIFMTDVPGLLKDCKDKSSRIGHVTPTDAQSL